MRMGCLLTKDQQRQRIEIADYHLLPDLPKKEIEKYLKKKKRHYCSKCDLYHKMNHREYWF